MTAALTATGTATAVKPAAPAPSVPAHRDSAYLRYLAGQAFSGLGDQVWYIALSWAAIHATSAGVAGFVLSVSAIPRLAFLLFGGVFADRFDIRRLMISSDVLRAGVCAAAALTAFLVSGTSLLMLLALALVFGTVDALFLPA